MCNEVESSSQGRSWKAGGKGGRRGASALVGNQDSSPESWKPSRLADNKPDSSMGKSGKCDVGGGDQQLSILLSSPSQTLFSSFAIFSRARLPCCWTGCWMALTGTSATAVNSLVTGPPAESNVSAELLLPAPLAQTSSVASAPIHAPYWRRRGLSVQIISPRPQSPYQPLGRPHFQPLQPLASPPCYLAPLPSI